MLKYIQNYYFYFSVAILSILAVGVIFDDPLKTNPVRSTTQEIQSVNDELASLKHANAWINTQPLTREALKGKVVLIEFGTYTCINWLRTLPYVRAWYEKYKAKGLVVIEVHTPEFRFEKDIDNVRRSIKDMKIGIPVAVDNDYTIWDGFNNSYWPALYFIDANGKIRHHQFGEGGYEQSERMIQQLLIEAGVKDIKNDFVSVNDRGIEAAADFVNLNSQENYLGYERTQNFASRGGMVRNKSNVYSSLSHLELNEWALSGDWLMKDHSVVLNKSNGQILYRFYARDIHLVMGPALRGASVRFRVLIDGKAPGSAHGLDVDAQGYGTVTEQRLYQLLRQEKPIKDREFVIEFLDPGIEAFAFTFG